MDVSRSQTGGGLKIARIVDEAAIQLGLTPAQVAITWTVARGGHIHPILGARSTQQIRDDLSALGTTLPEQTRQRLNEATAPELGFPTDYINQTSPWVFASSCEQTTTRPRSSSTATLSA